ncbi:exodeoxyribonuclease V, beta subunit, partial [Pasteurella multocida subsp. multocida str. Anand1_cattle]
EPLQTWLTTILNTPLLREHPVTLSALSAQDCIKEMEFYLKFEHEFQAHKFNQLLQNTVLFQHHYNYTPLNK